MCKKTLWKRFVSLVCALGIMCLTCVQSSFAVCTDSTSTKLEGFGGYTCEIEWISGVDFVIKGYLDGKLVDEVSGCVGGDTMLAKEFDENEDIVETETVEVSDVIRPAPQEVIDEMNESDLQNEVMPIAYDTYAGYVQYRIYRGSGYDYNNLYIFYDTIDSSYVSEYELHADEGKTLAFLAGAVLAATGVLMPTAMLAAVVGFLGGAVASGSVTIGAQGYFTGTLYDCNLEAESRVATPYVTKYYSGKAFDGRYKKGSTGAWQTGKAYEGYYPQFIREHDTAVATWLFNDFFEGSFNVYRWNSEI